MGDFTDKMAMGTSRMNPAKMLPGSTGNAPQNGLATQQKGSVAALLRSNPDLAGAGAAHRPAIPAAPANMIPQSLQNAPHMPVNSTYPSSAGGVDFTAKPRDTYRVSSAPNGPTPFHHLELSDGAPMTNWWEDKPEELMPQSSFLGPWAMNNEPIRSKTQSDLPAKTQQMLPSKNEKKSSTTYKKEDLQLLSDVFKTLSER